MVTALLLLCMRSAFADGPAEPPAAEGPLAVPDTPPATVAAPAAPPARLVPTSGAPDLCTQPVSSARLARVTTIAAAPAVDCAMEEELLSIGGPACSVLARLLTGEIPTANCPEETSRDFAEHLVEEGDPQSFGIVTRLAWGADSELREAVTGPMVARRPVLPEDLALSLVHSGRSGVVRDGIAILLSTGGVDVGSPVPDATLHAIRDVLLNGEVGARFAAARRLSGLWDHNRPGPSAWAPVIVEAALANIGHRGVMDNLMDILGWGGLPGMETVVDELIRVEDWHSVSRLLDDIEIAEEGSIGRASVVTGATMAALDSVMACSEPGLAARARKLARAGAKLRY